jgi:hypothetical protein
MTQGSFEPDGISLPAMRSPFRRIGIQTYHARPGGIEGCELHDKLGDFQIGHCNSIFRL